MNRIDPVPPSPRDSRDQEVSLRELWHSLWRNRWMVLGLTAVVVAITGAITMLVDPIYESEAVLRIRTKSSSNDFLSRLAPLEGFGLSGLGDDEIDTEMGILRSRRITSAAADSLYLNVELLEPDRSRGRVLRIEGTGREARAGEYTLQRTDAGDFELSFEETDEAEVEEAEVPIAPLPDRVAIGEPFRVGSLSVTLAPALGEQPPEEVRFRVRSFDRTVEDLRDRLKVDRQSIGSKLVEVSYRDSDPRLAAEVVNRVVDNYVSYKDRTGKADSRTTIEVLRDQVASYQRQLHDAEERLRIFQEQQRIIAPEEQATQQVRRLAEIQAKRDAIMVEREALAALLQQVGDGAPGAEGGSTYRRLATFPTFISNQAIQDLLRTLIELENERSELLVLRTEQNYDVRRLDVRIAELEQQLYRLGISYLGSLDEQLAAARNALDRFGREVEAVPVREVEFARLARDRELLQEVYLLLQTRLKEAEVQEAISPEDVRILDPALVPQDAVFPNPVVNLGLAVILGLMLGVSAVVLREMVSAKVRSQTDAEGAAAGVPVLGTIPPARITPVKAEGSGARRRVIWLDRIARAPQGRAPNEALVALHDPWNSASEAYRALLTTITLGGSGRPPQVVVVTSARAGDGPAGVAANLTVTLAQQGSRTLLLDADLRQGSLHRLFDVPPGPGLTDVLMGSASLESAIREVQMNGGSASLSFLAAGERPQHPGEFLSSQRLQELFRELRERFDYVLLSAPPLGLVADAVLLGTLADTTLLVARNGVTERDALERAATLLRRASVPVAGIVLSDVVESERGTAAAYQPAAGSSGNGRLS